MKSCAKRSAALLFVALVAAGLRARAGELPLNQWVELPVKTRLRSYEFAEPVYVPSRGQLLHWGAIRPIYRVPTAWRNEVRAFDAEAGAMVTYDPNWRPTLWSDPAGARGRILEGFDGTTVAKISDEEWTFVTGADDLAEGAKGVLDLLQTVAYIFELGDPDVSGRVVLEVFCPWHSHDTADVRRIHVRFQPPSQGLEDGFYSFRIGLFGRT